MDPVTLLVLAGAGLGGWAARRSHLAHLRRLAAEGSGFDDAADVALHVAIHEARARQHPWLAPVHLLYGLLQDEDVTGAVRSSGGDPDALEDRVLAALDEPPPMTEAEATERVIGYARGTAREAGGRPSCVNLWAGLGFSPQVGALCEAAGVDRLGALFRLFHGEVPAPVDDARGSLGIVLRNDDFTTKEFVAQLFEQVFGMPAADAIARMELIHAQGKSVLGPLPAREARAKVEDARQRARAAGFPLWIGLEPA